MNAPRLFARMFLVVLVSFFASALRAQTQTTGDLVGTVTDPVGAVIPSAKVVLKDEARGAAVDTVTNASGDFHFYLLTPGAYSVVVRAPGFQTLERPVEVSLGQVATANVQLSIGSETQTITVTGATPLLQTEDGNTGISFDERHIQQIPNPGNDITFTAQMAPGAVMNTTGGAFGSLSSLGMGANQNIFTLNGMDYMDPFFNLNQSGATNLTLGNSEVQDVSILQNAYAGQYGTLAGAQVNYVTRGGSNHIHGSATYYWNGRALNANDWFNKAARLPRQFVNANAFSADLGGPLVRDKLFWYFNMEGLYLVIPTGGPVLVPSDQFAAQTQANIVSLFGAGSPSDTFYKKIFSLYAATPGRSGAAPALGGGCDFSTAELNAHLPIGAAQFGAGPGQVPCALQFQSSVSSKTHDRVFVGRVDWNAAANDRIFLRVQKEHGFQPSYTDPISPLFSYVSDQPEYQGQLQWTHAFTSAVNQFNASAQWYSSTFNNANRAASLAAFPTNMFMGAGQFSFLGGLNAFVPQGRNVTQVQFSDDFSKTIGHHTLRVGMKFRRNDITDYDNGSLTIGELVPFTLDALYMGGFDPLDSSNNFTLLAQAFAQQQKFPVAMYGLGAYVEDGWKVTRNLSVNLAFRFEHDSNPVCPSKCFAAPVTAFTSLNHDPNIPYNQAIATGRRQALPSLTAWNPQPRLSFAYAPELWGRRNSVIRGGIGIFYDAFPAIVVDSFAQNPPLYNTFVVGSSFAPLVLTPGQNCGGSPCNVFDQASASNTAFLAGFKNGATLNDLETAVPGFAPPALTSAENNPKIPQYQKWSLAVQHSFGSKTSFTLEYAGSHGIHIPFFNNGLNAFAFPFFFPTGYGDLPAAPADPRFGAVTQIDSNAVSSYNGLLASFSGRFGPGEVQLNYAWSHALDEVSNGGNGRLTYENTQFGAGNTSVTYPEDPFHPRKYNYGNADYDVTHYFSASYVWSLPVRRALLGHGWSRAVEGWQLSGTLFAHTGLPYTLIDGATSGFLGAMNYGAGEAIFGTRLAPGGENANCKTVFGSGPDRNMCLDPANFTTSTSGFGNVTRNQLRGPNYFNTSMSVMKFTRLPRWEQVEFGVGAQFFNLFNHPNFVQPLGDVSNSALFGQVLRTASAPTSIYGASLGGNAAPRTIQLKAQLRF